MTFFRLSKRILNRSKSPWRPRMSGVDSLVERKAVALKGIFPSFNRILATNTVIPRPSMPYECVLGRRSRLSPMISAKEAGSMVKSAPVSRRKGKDLKPRRVLRKTGIFGFEILPRSVFFSRRGKTIDTSRIGTFYKLNFDMGTPSIFQHFFNNGARPPRMGNNSPLISGDILPAIPFLQDRIVDFRLHASKTIMGVNSCQ